MRTQVATHDRHGRGKAEIGPVTQRIAALDISECNRGVGFDGVILIGECALEIALQAPRLSAFAEADRHAWIDSNCFRVFDDRAGELALVTPDCAKIAADRAVLR